MTSDAPTVLTRSVIADVSVSVLIGITFGLLTGSKVIDRAYLRKITADLPTGVLIDPRDVQIWIRRTT